MGLSANAFLSTLLDKYSQYEDYVSLLSTQEIENNNAILQNETKSSNLQREINRENDVLEQYQQELFDILNNENPLNQIYCGIKEFVIDNSGMCGMGMGMGHMEVNSNIKLTGKELLAMSSVLNGNADGQYSPCELVEQLKSMGIDNAKLSDDGGSIVLTRSDGSCVKFCDANGDGMLNGCDYDFSDALAKFNDDMNEFNAKVDEMNSKIDAQETKIAGLEDDKSAVDDTIANLVRTGEEIADEIENTNNEMAKLQGQINDVQAQIEAEDAEAQEPDEAETPNATVPSGDEPVAENPVPDDSAGVLPDTTPGSEASAVIPESMAAQSINLTVKMDLNGDGVINELDQRIADAAAAEEDGLLLE